MRQFFSVSDSKAKSPSKDQLNLGRLFKRLKTSKRTPSTSIRLPNELYRLILAFLPLDTKLYPLLFVNSIFTVEVIRVLYSNISLVEGIHRRLDMSMYLTIERHNQLFQLLARTARLSRLVHSIAVPSYTGTGPYGIQELYWRRLNVALCAMPNLKEFVYGERGYWITGLVSQSLKALFKGCTFRLRKFTIASLGLKDYDLKVLESDAIGGELEELSMPLVYDGQSDVHSAFPRLAVLEISNSSYMTSMPTLMAPPRTIKALSLWAPKLSQPCTYPDVFSLRIGAWDSFDWSRLAIVLPSLRFLSINDPSISAQPSKEKADLAFLTNMTTHHIPGLVHLRKVTFDGETLRLPQMSRQRQRFASDLLSRVLHLEVVCIGADEWSRVQLKQGRPRVYGRLDEWKDGQWWNSS